MDLRKVGEDYIYTSCMAEKPIPNISVYDFMFNRRKHGSYPPVRDDNRVALIDDESGIHISFETLKQRVDNLSKAFWNILNIRRGDIVCIYSPNNVSLHFLGFK